MSSDAPMWLENLEEWILDENRIVTAKLVSRALRVHINTAKERLFHFAKVNRVRNDLEVILLIAGKDPEGRRTVRLVRESSSSEAEEMDRLSEVTSKHVYAVGRRDAFGKNDQALTLALMDAAKEDPYLTTFNAIVNKKAVPRNNELSMDKPAAAVEEEEVKVEKVKKEPSTSASVFPTDPVSQPKCYPGARKGKSGAIANMFAKAVAKKKDDEDTRKQLEDETVGSRKRKEQPDTSLETSPGKENRANEEREREEKRLTRQKNAEEADRKKRPKGGSAKSSQPKRKRIQMMADSDSSADEKEEDVEVEDVGTIDSPPPPQAPLIESDDEDIIPPTPETKTQKGQNPGTRRKRSRKVVEKTFKDEDGFTVTKREYESCSETDNEEEDSSSAVTVLAASKKANTEAASIAAPKAVVKEPAGKKPRAKKNDDSPQKTKQASIMNFFKKK